MGNLPGYLSGGIINKYQIGKADGSAVDPDARYFVLRLDKDPHARAAIRAYRDSVGDENPTLAWEIGKALEETEGKFRRQRIGMAQVYAAAMEDPRYCNRWCIGCGAAFDPQDGGAVCDGCGRPFCPQCASSEMKPAGEWGRDGLRCVACREAAADADPDAGGKVECRKCSECVGLSHHWIESTEVEGAEFVCKHCGQPGIGCKACSVAGCDACNGEGVLAKVGEDPDGQGEGGEDPADADPDGDAGQADAAGDPDGQGGGADPKPAVDGGGKKSKGRKGRKGKGK